MESNNQKKWSQASNPVGKADIESELVEIESR